MANRVTNSNPPQAKNAWPLIGHLHLLGGSQSPHKVLGTMAEKYGPIFTIKLGVHQALVVNNAELAREYLTKNDKAFVGRPKALAFELMAYNYAVFGFSPIISGKRFSLDFDEQSGFQDLGGYKKMMKKTGKQLDQILEGWLKDQKLKRSELAAQHEEGFGVEPPPRRTMAWWFMVVHMAVDAGDAQKSSEVLIFIIGVENVETVECVRGLRVKSVVDVGYKESDTKNLVYLKAVIKETLRLHPVVPLSVPHESIEDCVVGGYNIPKGTRLMVNLSKIHRDPNTWSNPHEFQPERFLTSHHHLDVKGQHFDLIPFGAGRRMCPGDTFALHEMRLTLASLIQQFELETSSNEPVDMSASFGITVSKQMPLEVLLAPRLTRDMYGLGT
ncbi:hypothetical protein E3N88_16309 [Mikania micrantha]|uniref:Cytochrome P450 n=1 Tax=Mikania micrantha TaxID=192012 RepID=A0A5N6NY43_9ASTR|nr:hypothetical protein E3N88_16309 [Mikania micrantha]